MSARNRLMEIPMKNLSQGFTLIEMMIVVAIAGILAAVAYNSYTGYVTRGNRAEAKSAMYENAQFLERNFTLANRYDKNTTGADITLPITQTPVAGAAKYTITHAAFDSSAVDTTYTLIATPAVNDGCGNLTLNQAGVKGLAGTYSKTVADCWGK
jgi:type IV pilus assembly protein PilE